MTCPPISITASYDQTSQTDGMLIVTGFIMTIDGGVKPELSVWDKQGNSPSILWLDMKLEPSGSASTEEAVQVPFHFEKPAKPGQYVAVEVFVDGTLCVATEVKQANS